MNPQITPILQMEKPENGGKELLAFLTLYSALLSVCESA